MFDQEILKPRHACKYTGLETVLSHAFSSIVSLYTCDKGKARAVFYLDGVAVSGLLLEKTGNFYTILGRYTLDNHRGKGYAKNLLAVASAKLGTVAHSEYLTDDGKKATRKGNTSKKGLELEKVDKIFKKAFTS